MSKPPDASREQHLELARRAIREVRDNGPALPGVTELAGRLGVSEAHLRRVFVRMTGQKLGQYQASMRLLNSAHALCDTDQSILSIALETGYANHESFSRAFRAAFGVSPREYRNTNSARKESQMVASPSDFTIQLVKVPVTDFGKARRFYRDVLGLPEAFAVEAYGWAQYDTGGVRLCLYVVGMGGGDGEPGGDTGFHLTHPDLAAVYEKLIAAGTPPVHEIVDSDDGGRYTVVRDPDGNTFKLVQNV